MNPKNTSSTVPTAVSFATLAAIQFLTILFAYAGFQEVGATSNNLAVNISNTTSAAIPSDVNAPTMSIPSASNISNTTSAAVPSDVNAPTMSIPSASNISNTTSAAVPSDVNAPTMQTP